VVCWWLSKRVFGAEKKGGSRWRDGLSTGCFIPTVCRGGQFQVGPKKATSWGRKKGGSRFSD